MMLGLLAGCAWAAVAASAQNAAAAMRRTLNAPGPSADSRSLAARRIAAPVSSSFLAITGDSSPSGRHPGAVRVDAVITSL